MQICYNTGGTQGTGISQPFWHTPGFLLRVLHLNISFGTHQVSSWVVHLNISFRLVRSVEQETRYGTTFLKPGTTISISSILQRHMDQKKVTSICLSKKENISVRSSIPYNRETDIMRSYEQLYFGHEHI